MPLALLELPLFVLLPAFYSQVLGMDLALIGAVLFGARLIDAVADPLIGAAIDRNRRRWGYRRWIWASLPVLALGFWAMFAPPVEGGALAAWLAATSLATYLAYSAASIAYQAWGAELGTGERERARVTGVREAFGLAGVIAASALLVPERAPWLVAGFALLSAIAAAALRAAPLPARHPALGGVVASTTAAVRAGPGRVWAIVGANRGFRWLLAAFVINGVATALPATLVLFYVGDVLEAADRVPLFLVSYFLAGALGMPLWVWLAGRIGLRSAWLVGMAAAVLAFVWALGLGPNDVLAFWAVCVLTGLALGADLALPPALLATVIAERGDDGRHEGAYFGVWNLATKLNLAIAAGLGLPLLALFDYVPGQPGSPTLPLVLAYAALPSALKLAAGALLLLAPPGARGKEVLA